MADERRKRIPRPWLWALAGAAFAGVLVFVFAVAPSLLVGSPTKGLGPADVLKARNDLRATLVAAISGLVVAGGLVVTYRQTRLQQLEQNRTYQLHQQEQDLTRQEQDRTYETELFAKAVEQLGHDKAPVRLGALYSLERLAEDKPERRQMIVDVICTYLRMPFSSIAPAIKPEPEATEAPEVPGAETERRTEGTGDTWRQERQVRLTAQHILTEHLARNRPRNGPNDPPNPRFWPDIRLNLDGATLIDFDLGDCQVAEATFNGATFAGVADFDYAIFTGPASFHEAKFTGDARFSAANFAGDGRIVQMTWFNEAAFAGHANFSGATFGGGVMFSGATFTHKADFPAVVGWRLVRIDSGEWKVVRADDPAIPAYRPELPTLPD